MQSVLSVFPNLFDYQIYAEFILRIIVGCIFVFFAYDKLLYRSQRKVFHKKGAGFRRTLWAATTTIEAIGGFFLVIGLWVQPTALVLTLVMLCALGIKLRNGEVLENTAEFFFLVIAVLIALLLLPPQIASFDLPL